MRAYANYGAALSRVAATSSPLTTCSISRQPLRTPAPRQPPYSAHTTHSGRFSAQSRRFPAQSRPRRVLSLQRRPWMVDDGRSLPLLTASPQDLTSRPLLMVPAALVECSPWPRSPVAPARPWRWAPVAVGAEAPCTPRWRLRRVNAKGCPRHHHTEASREWFSAFSDLCPCCSGT